jgi:anti-anti-sigma factor
MSVSLLVRHGGGRALVDVEGDLDVNSAPWLQQRLLHLLRGDEPRVLVDLSGVTFIDCFAARLLAETCRQAEQQGGSMQFIELSAWVQRVAELTGLAGRLPVTGPATAGVPDPDSCRARGRRRRSALSLNVRRRSARRTAK